MVKFSKKNSRTLADYYAQEETEHNRLYDFLDSYHLYYDQRRVNTVVQLAKAVETDGSFLDIGCGSGYYVTRFSIGKCLSVGTDISNRKLKCAKDKVGQNADFIVCDARRLPFRHSSFDFVLCSEVIEHLQECLTALKEIHRICKCYAIITTPTKTTFWRLLMKHFRKDIPYGPTHIYEYSQEELLNLLGNLFAVRKISAAPLLEFPGLFILLKNHRLARALYLLDVKIARAKIFSRFGVFSCILCSKLELKP